MWNTGRFANMISFCDLGKKKKKKKSCFIFFPFGHRFFDYLRMVEVIVVGGLVDKSRGELKGIYNHIQLGRELTFIHL